VAVEPKSPYNGTQEQSDNHQDDQRNDHRVEFFAFFLFHGASLLGGVLHFDGVFHGQDTLDQIALHTVVFIAGRQGDDPIASLGEQLLPVVGVDLLIQIAEKAGELFLFGEIVIDQQMFAGVGIGGKNLVLINLFRGVDVNIGIGIKKIFAGKIVDGGKHGFGGAVVAIENGDRILKSLGVVLLL